MCHAFTVKKAIICIRDVSPVSRRAQSEASFCLKSKFILSVTIPTVTEQVSKTSYLPALCLRLSDSKGTFRKGI